MSREQWGHGYWKGVEDANSGKVRTPIEDEAKHAICLMCASNEKKEYDRTLFPVREFIAFCHMAGLGEKYAKNVYDYVMNNMPYGAYISGGARNPWYEDYFVVPVWDEDADWWRRELNSIEEKWDKINKEERR